MGSPLQAFGNVNVTKLDSARLQGPCYPCPLFVDPPKGVEC